MNCAVEIPAAFEYYDVTVSGQKIRAAVRPGNKSKLTPLLIFNGIGASLELVFPFAAALDPNQEVIAFDVPGVGASPASILPYTFTGLAHTVTRMLDALGYTEVNVAGISWGGFLAQQFAYNHPDRCKKLILAATSSGVTMIPPSMRVLMLMASPERYTNPEHMAEIAPEIYGGSFRNNPELCTSYANKMKAPTSDLGYRYQQMAVWWWSSAFWLHRLKQPTLVMAGNDDPIIPLCNMKFIASRIPNAQFHEIDDGHLFLVTKAVEIAPVVMKFLRQPC